MKNENIPKNMNTKLKWANILSKKNISRFLGISNNVPAHEKKTQQEFKENAFKNPCGYSALSVP